MTTEEAVRWALDTYDNEVTVGLGLQPGYVVMSVHMMHATPLRRAEVLADLDERGASIKAPLVRYDVNGAYEYIECRLGDTRIDVYRPAAEVV